MAKQKSIQLSVPKPCTQAWDDMTPKTNGRHCDSCNSSVIDFSKFTDREIIEVLKNIKGSFCGRFTEYQVNRPIAIPAQNNNSFLSKAMFGTVLLAGVATATNAQASHQAVISPVQVPVPIPINNTNYQHKANKENQQNTNPKQISGIVTDIKTGVPIPYVNITIEGTSIVTRSDSGGKFTITVPDTLTGKITIDFHKFWHKERDFTLKTTKLPTYMKVGLRPKKERIIMGRTFNCPAF
jgi:hypothetical protein